MNEPSDDSDEIIAEDWPTYYTQVPVWILLATITAQAYRMYAFLAEHINNRQPGKRISCPKQKAIALVLGLKNPKQVGRYGVELQALGAIRIEEYRYAGGMRRGYKYHVRFNPPPNYAGLLALSQFYAANPDVKSAPNQGRVSAAKKETAGQTRGTEKSTSGGTANSPMRGAPDRTAHGTQNRSPERDQSEEDQNEPTLAPSARSGGDGRRPTSVRTARAAGGSAASGKNQRLTPQQGKQIHAVLRELPEYLAQHLPAKRPAALSNGILAALATGTPHERTPAQLVQFRVMARWDGYWGSLFGRGKVEKPVGAFLRMIERQAECGNARCDDRVDVDSGGPCTSCSTRVDDKRQERKAAASAQVAEEHGAATADWYPSMPDAGSGTPPEWAFPEQRDDGPRCPVPVVPTVGRGAQPNSEYRQQREAARARKANQNA